MLPFPVLSEKLDVELTDFRCTVYVRRERRWGEGADRQTDTERARVRKLVVTILCYFVTQR